MISPYLHRSQIAAVRRKYLTLCAILLLIFLTVAPGARARQAPAAQNMRLNGIEFSGLQQHSQDEAIAASGLRIGQSIDIPALDAAAQRLMDSGLFKKLSYRYRTNGNQATVVFLVEEASGARAPVVFDNFVWFSDEELLNAVRRQVPDFDGRARDEAIDGITKSLQQLLQERKIKGQVEYAPSVDLSTGKQLHIFSVEGVKIPICTLHFSGATAIQESELLRNSRPLTDSDYKRSFVLSFAETNLIPLYRERGHLRASFSAPEAKLETNSDRDCQNGVAVTLTVAEGPVYSWDKAEWVGNTALSTPELNWALGMKAGELANGLKIDKGLEAAHKAYENRGYLTARLKAAPVFEDPGQRVTYHVEIKEGPQYRMGMLTMTGLPESTIERLKERWSLHAGDVYNAYYLAEFLKKEVPKEITAEMRENGSAPKSIDSRVKPDPQRLIVDVTINFK